MWESECRGAGASRFEMEGLEVLMLREECGKVGKAFNRTPQIVESERSEVFPASTRIEVVRDGVSEPGTTWNKVCYIKILQQVQTMGYDLKCENVPLGWGNS